MDALDVSCEQLTRDLFAIAKFLLFFVAYFIFRIENVYDRLFDITEARSAVWEESSGICVLIWLLIHRAGTLRGDGMLRRGGRRWPCGTSTSLAWPCTTCCPTPSTSFQCQLRGGTPPPARRSTASCTVLPSLPKRHPPVLPITRLSNCHRSTTKIPNTIACFRLRFWKRS